MENIRKMILIILILITGGVVYYFVVNNNNVFNIGYGKQERIENKAKVNLDNTENNKLSEEYFRKMKEEQVAKSKDASITSYLSQIPMMAVMANPGSYSGVCSDPNIKSIIESAVSKSPEKQYICRDSDESFVISVKKNDGKYICVDPMGIRRLEENVSQDSKSCD